LRSEFLAKLQAVIQGLRKDFGFLLHSKRSRQEQTSNQNAIAHFNPPQSSSEAYPV